MSGTAVPTSSALTYTPGMFIALCRDDAQRGSMWVWHYLYHSEHVDRTPGGRLSAFLDIVVRREWRRLATVS